MEHVFEYIDNLDPAVLFMMLLCVFLILQLYLGERKRRMATVLDNALAYVLAGFVMLAVVILAMHGVQW